MTMRHNSDQGAKRYGFQNFNLVRRIARELLVNGYRGYREFIDLPGDTDSTYNDRVEKVYYALDTCLIWPDRGRKSIWTDEMRIAQNPLYSLFKTRSMTGNSQYALHFALLDILSDGEWHALADVHAQLIGDGAGARWDERALADAIQRHLEAGRLRRARDGRYTLPADIRARVAGTNQELAMQPFLRALANRKKLGEAELIEALRDDALKRRCYGLIYIGQKNQISQRIDGYYLPRRIGIIRKDSRRGYALAGASLQGILERFPALADAIAFFSEYSPLGVIGSFLMDAYEIENLGFLFKNQHIAQALDSIVLYDVLNAIAKGTPVDIYAEQYSRTVPEVLTVYPICVLSGTADGRQFIYAYDPGARAYIFIRLDYVHGVIPQPSLGRMDEAVAAAGRRKLKHAWGATVGGAPHRVRVNFLFEEEYVFQNICRERRGGTVTPLGANEAQFDVRVCRPHDLAPWLLSHMGRLKSIRVDRNRRGGEDSRLCDRMRAHVEDLYRMYHGLKRLPFRETPAYYPVSRDLLDYLDGKTKKSRGETKEARDKAKESRESPLFQSIYSKYIQCIRAILARTGEPLSANQIRRIIVEEKAKHHISPLDREITFDHLILGDEGEGWGVIQPYNEHQRLVGGDEDPRHSEAYRSFLVRGDRVPPLPLTEIERRWLKTILRDDKIGLFLDDAEVAEIAALLRASGGDDRPLYGDSDLLCYDRFNDGDDIRDPQYRAVFRTLLAAIRGNVREVRIAYRSQKEKRLGCAATVYYVKPFRLEYSKQADKFQLLGMFTQFPPPGASLVERDDTESFSVRLSNIESAEIVDDAADRERPDYAESECEEPIELRVLNINGAIERFNLAFSPYKKITEFEGRRRYDCSDGRAHEVDSCRAALYYSSRDENEILSKLRSFGRAIEILSPERVRQDFIGRVDMQYRIFVESGFMEPVASP